MDSKFKSPKTKEELIERAEKIELKAALALRHSIQSRIASATRAYIEELKFHEAVIKLKTEGPDAVVWPPEEAK